MAPFEAGAEDIDFELLARYLKALAHPGRLELLWRLRHPSSAAALEVKPHRRDALSPDRPISRQALGTHLEKLEEIGAVARVDDPGSEADRWATNVPHVFALVEELRKLTAIPPPAAVDVEQTMERDREAASAWPRGPKLVLLSGPWQGRTFALQGLGPWTVGRSRSRTVALAYDPFVSAEHASILRGEGGFALEVGAETRNPTRVNLMPVAPAAPRALAHGDIVEVGKSLLVFHER